MTKYKEIFIHTSFVKKYLRSKYFPHLLDILYAFVFGLPFKFATAHQVSVEVAAAGWTVDQDQEHIHTACRPSDCKEVKIYGISVPFLG